MAIKIVEYDRKYIAEAVLIWNEVVAEGIAFPQEEPLDERSGDEFFRSQSFTGLALEECGAVIGLYILHPNNVGRCGHISNASYAVKGSVRGRHIGEQLVMHSLTKGRELGFKRFFRRHHPAISSAMKFLSRRRRPKKRGRQ